MCVKEQFRALCKLFSEQKEVNIIKVLNPWSMKVAFSVFRNLPQIISSIHDKVLSCFYNKDYSIKPYDTVTTYTFAITSNNNQSNSDSVNSVSITILHLGGSSRPSLTNNSLDVNVNMGCN